MKNSLQNIWMMTTEEPKETSGYLYVYEDAIPEVAATYANVTLRENLPKNALSKEDTLLIVSEVKTALKYRKEGYAVLLQTEDFSHAPILPELPYVTDYPCDLSDEELERYFMHLQGFPVTIAETERLILREVTLDDLPALYELYDDDEVRKFLEPLYSFEEETAFQKDYIKTMYGIYGYGLWVVIEKKSDKLIGRVGISNRMIDGEERQEIGYVIHKDYRRQGYAFEACQAVLMFAQNAKMEGLLIVTDLNNLPSCELAAKLGFAPLTMANGCEYMIFQHKE